jgi:translation initiation factor 2 alpha subunit (eIF-2alpha)
MLLEERYIQLLNEEKLAHDKRKQVVGVFLTYACDELGIDTPPKIFLNSNPDFGPKFKSFGHFHVTDDKIVVASSNRNLADILRTIAHELTHYKQKLDGKLNLNNSEQSGADGSDIEDSANAKAGVIMRKFGRKHPEIYE